jgi:tetratricopeptide (TPR) repeat protein
MLQESVVEMEKALEIDPKNPNYGRLGISYLALNEFDKAFETFAIGKETSYVLIWQGITLYRKGDLKQALAYFDRTIQRQVEPYILNSSIAFKAMIEGDLERGLKAVKTLEDADITDIEGWYYWSVMYAILGDKEGGLRCLKKAVEGGYYNYPLIKEDPFLENLRGSPEYDAILEQAQERHLYFKSLFFDENT